MAKGIVLEISADTKEFNKGIKEAKAQANSLQGEAIALQKSLKFNYDETNLVKAQKKCQEALDQTASTADTLQKRLAFLEDGGHANTAEYSKVRQELTKAEIKAQQLKGQMDELNRVKLNHVASQVESVGSKIQSVGKVASVFSGIAIAAGTALGKLGFDAISSADDVATLATQYNTTATEIQRMQYIAMQSDVSETSLYKGLIKTRSAVADFSNSTSNEATKAIESLGLNLDGLSDTDAFNKIVASLADVDDKTQMVATANAIFGDKIANDLLPMLYSGSEAINEYSQEFEKVGALSDEQVSALAEFDNIMNKIKIQLKNASLQIGSSLLPLMQSIANVISNSVVPKLEQLSNWFNSLSIQQTEMAAKIILVVAALGPIILLIGKLTSGVGGLIKMIPLIITGLNTLAAHPIILIIMAMVAVIALLYAKCEVFRESINGLVGVLSTALGPILSTVGAIIKPFIGMLGTIIDLIGVSLAPVIDLLASFLTPLVNRISFLFSILQPLIKIALIPLQLHLKALQIPIKLIGTLIGWLSGLFSKFGDVQTKIFQGVINWINKALGVVESAINWIIDKMNIVIRGLNKIPGVNISQIDQVELSIGGSVSPDEMEKSANEATTGESESNDYIYDTVDTSSIDNSVSNYDYSIKNTTQNITVTIENYAAEVDTDALVEEINLKLAMEV